MTASAVLSLIDAAQPFVDIDPATLAQAVRRFGLEQLNAARAELKASAGDDRAVKLSAIAEALGRLVAAGALEEPFVKAVLEEEASQIGLIRDLGLKPVQRAIAAGTKAGKKSPYDLSEVRSAAATPLGGAQSGAGEDGRAPLARDRMSSIASTPPPLRVAASSPSVAVPSAAESAENASSQMGDWPDASASDGGEGDGGVRPPEESGDDRNMRLAFFPFSDLGNAERLHARNKGCLIWNVALGWLIWDGKRWSRNGAEDLLRIALHGTVRAIQIEARAVRDSGRKDVVDAERGARDYLVDEKKGTLYSDKIASWGRASESSNRLTAMAKEGAPYFAVAVDKLDGDKMKINVNNGTLVVRRKSDGDYIEFKRHDPADLITKLAPVDYDPAALCPDYDGFLQRVQPAAEMRHYLHQWFGLSMTGDVSEQKLMFLYGKGANGKSVLVDTISFIAGDYGETVPIETFLDQGKSRSAGQATPDLAILPGVRMLRTSEPEKNSRLAEAMIKLITGGEPIQARHLNRDFFKFYPQFKMTVSGNYNPAVSGSDEGIWRRLRKVPFDVFIPPEERDVHLPDKLRAEASGILNRLLDGLRSWCDTGLTEPTAVAEATAAYRSSSDPFGRFASQCLVASLGDRVQSSVLHEVFVAWCKSSGEKEWSNRGLSLAMEERGYKRIQSNVMWWTDIKLVKSVGDFVDAQGHPIKMDSNADSKKAEDDEI